MDFALRDLGFDVPMLAAIHDMFDFGDESDQTRHHPSKAYIRDSKAMKATPADVIEYPQAYHFVVDMPGLKRDQVKVHLEDGNVLVITGERRRETAAEAGEKEKEKEKQERGVKFLRMERRFGKLLKKFVLPENANTDTISAALEDGVLTVSVEKRPPPEPKKPKVIEVNFGQQVGDAGGSNNDGERGQIQDGNQK